MLQHVQLVTDYIYRHEEHFRRVMEKQLHAESAKQIAANRKALDRSRKRLEELEADVIRLEKEIEVQETQIKNIESFIQKSGQYVGIEVLTPYALHELVKAIYVDAPDKSSGKRTQHIHIQYDGLGFIPLNELLASEKA